MRVAVIGGGLIGLFAAYHLRRRGVEVIVLERGRAGAACSSGNAGWITPSIAVPVPSPGLRSTSLRWLLQPDSPLYIKPSAIPRLAPWLWRFWRHCNSADFERGCRALAEIGADTLNQFDELEAEGLVFGQRRDGLLMLFAKQSALGAERALLERAGYGPVELLDSEEIRDREPALGGIYCGGLHVLPERHVRPELLSRRIAERIRELGVELREGVEVEGFGDATGRVRELRTAEGEVAADAFVIATGAEASRLARQCGSRLPIQAGKGYSVTVDDPRTHINTPIYFAETKLGLASYDGALRVAGTMELSGINLRLDPRRIAAFRRTAEGEVPGIFEGASAREWVGMRPLTPDGLPVIGRLARHDNVFIASGHQMLGVKLAPSTGRVLAELVVTGETEVDLTPFAPDRFNH